MSKSESTEKPIRQMDNPAYVRKDDEDFDRWARRILVENPSMYYSPEFIQYAVDLEHSEHKVDRDAFASLPRWVRASGSYRINKFNKLVKLENAERRKLQVTEMRNRGGGEKSWAEAFGLEINEELRTAPGYAITEEGIFKATYKEKVDGTMEESSTLIAPDPILVTDSIQSIDDKTAYIEVTYRYRNAWNVSRWPRRNLADQNLIKKYAEFGLPVASYNADDVSQMVLATEKANEDIYDGTHCTRYIGWTHDNSGFLVDGRHITSPDNESRLIYVPAEDDSSDLWAALVGNGELAAWKLMAEKVLDHPRAYMCLLASLSAPLLKLLDLKNYIIDLAGESGGGKTTAVCFAASAWGYCPSQASGTTRSMKRSWNATVAGAERSLSAMRGIPSIFDETKLANKIEDVSRIAYMVANSIGRTRATATGSQASTAFNTVMLSTGEDRLVDLARKNEGVRRRTIQLDALPFGSTQQSALVKEIEQCGVTHYGRAGAAFVERLLADSSEHTNWKAYIAEQSAYYLAQATGMDSRRGVASSLADVAALLDLTGHLCVEYGVLPGEEYQSPVAECVVGVYEQAASADQTKEAMLSILEVIASNQKRMRGSDEDNKNNHEPSQGYIGVYAMVGGDQCASVGSSWCREELVRLGYVPETITKEWHRRGWLKSNTDKPTAVAEISKGMSSRVFAIKQNAIDDIIRNS